MEEYRIRKEMAAKIGRMDARISNLEKEADWLAARLAAHHDGFYAGAPDAEGSQRRFQTMDEAVESWRAAAWQAVHTGA